MTLNERLEQLRSWVHERTAPPSTRPPAVVVEDDTQLIFSVGLDIESARVYLEKALEAHVQKEVDRLAEQVARSFLTNTEEGQGLTLMAHDIIARYPHAGIELENRMSRAIADTIMKSYQR
jgi:hypothetical protein